MTANSTGMLLKLDGSLTIHRAQELKSLLLEAIEETDQLILDLSQVTAVDLAGLQILCAAHRTLIKNGKTLSLAKPISNAFKQGLNAAGYQNCSGPKDLSGIWKGDAE